MNYIWIFIGFLSLALGTLGICLPVLPTVPFYLLTTFCFAKGSKRLHRWFSRTKLYKNHLKNYIENKAMTLSEKIWIILSLSILFGFGFVMMKKVLIARIILLLIWTVHIWYFIFKIKTWSKEEKADASNKV